MVAAPHKIFDRKKMFKCCLKGEKHKILFFLYRYSLSSERLVDIKITKFYAEIVVQLVAKKTGKENFPNVNLVSSLCQLIV
jgi:hypothetical protein